MFDRQKVLDVAAAQLGGHSESGGALCVILGGEELIWETWGVADPVRGTPYSRDTLQITQSMAKGVCAALLAMLVDRGQIEVDQKVGAYWPEFATPEKRDVTVAQLLSHQAGLPYLDGGMPLELVADRPRLAAALAAQKPAWEPGSRFGYHPQTFGNYADILFERASGKGVCDLLAELCPQIDAEIYCGLPVTERGRAAISIFPDEASRRPSPEMLAMMDDPDNLIGRILANMPNPPQDFDTFVNSDGLKDVCVPGANMFTNALSLARLYSCLGAGGVWRGRRVIGAEAIDAVVAERVSGADASYGMQMSFGIGFQHPSPTYPFSPNPRAFGHGGAGGSMAFADPDAGLALAWIPNLIGGLPDTRTDAVVAAVYEALG